MVQLRIGTCSWKFPSWHGLVYSQAKDVDYLQEYAQRYDTVEIDQWFWSRFSLGEVSLPDPADVAAYRAAVPDDFCFTVKAPNSVTLTHLYQEEKDHNPKYLNDAYFRFLSANRLIPVLLQGYWMLPIWGVYAAHRERILDHETVVIRLLGPDRKGIEEHTGKRWDRLVAPKDEELPKVVDMAHDLMNEGLDVYVNVNNHYEGSAPLTIERIKELL